jgi:hypothetical protein
MAFGMESVSSLVTTIINKASYDPKNLGYVDFAYDYPDVMDVFFKLCYKKKMKNRSRDYGNNGR